MSKGYRDLGSWFDEILAAAEYDERRITINGPGWGWPGEPEVLDFVEDGDERWVWSWPRGNGKTAAGERARAACARKAVSLEDVEQGRARIVTTAGDNPNLLWGDGHVPTVRFRRRPLW
ncbi:hypothetical protein [Dactylosporangium sp. CS-033363]|uniref:hypothetical protein n=1 Tax=Dactylosporangium sp. CS-033363 TaxID=3239935 RepID=UPI003D8B4304